DHEQHHQPDAGGPGPRARQDQGEHREHPGERDRGLERAREAVEPGRLGVGGRSGPSGHVVAHWVLAHRVLAITTTATTARSAPVIRRAARGSTAAWVRAPTRPPRSAPAMTA